MAMNKRLSRKQIFSNKISLTKDDDVYVGIDVHKRSYIVAIWISDAPAVDFVMPTEANETLTTSDESQATSYAAASRLSC